MISRWYSCYSFSLFHFPNGNRETTILPLLSPPGPTGFIPFPGRTKGQNWRMETQKLRPKNFGGAAGIRGIRGSGQRIQPWRKVGREEPASWWVACGLPGRTWHTHGPHGDPIGTPWANSFLTPEFWGILGHQKKGTSFGPRWCGPFIRGYDSNAVRGLRLPAMMTETRSEAVRHMGPVWK